MANKTVYPYGTGGHLPASIGIVNDLKTGGVDKALSAQQGVVIGNYIDSQTVFSKQVTPIASGSNQNVFSGYILAKGSVNAPCVYVPSWTCKCIVIDVEGFDNVRFLGIVQKSSTADAGYAFYDSSNYNTGTNSWRTDKTGALSYAGYDYNTSLDTPITKEYVLEVPSGAKYLKISYSYGPLTESNFYCYCNKVDETYVVRSIGELKEDLSDVEEETTQNSTTLEAVIDDLYGADREIEEPVNFISETLYKISLDSDYFYQSTASVSYRGYRIEVPEGVEQVVITPGSYGTYLCIAKTEVPTGSISGSSFVTNYKATGCDGYDPTSPSVYRMIVPLGSSQTIKLSKNAKYIYIQKNFTNTSQDFTPASVVFSGHLRKDGRLDSLGEASNGIFESISFSKGTLNEAGVVVADETHLISNPIPTSLGYVILVNSPTYLIESVALFNNNGKCVDRYHWTYIQGLTGKYSTFGSAVDVSGYYVRFVLEKQDGTAASVDDNIVKQFTLLNDSRLHRLIPDNPKYQYYMERIKALTNTIWEAILKVPAPHAKLPYYYNAGTTNFGIPYSDVGEYSKYVGIDVSIRTFLTSLLNPRSVMYTDNASSEASSSKYGLVYHNWQNAAGAYYGTVCSGLTAYSLNLPTILNSDLYGTGMISGESVIAKGDQNNLYYVKNGSSWVPCTGEDIIELIQPMDLITSPGHVSMISEIYVDEFNNKKFVIWAEETSGATPTAKRTPYNTERFLNRLNGYAATATGWTICRYSDWSNVVPVQGDRDNVPMNFYDYPKHLSIDPDICTYTGDYVVFVIGDPADTANNNKAFLNIHRNKGVYDTLQIFAEASDESTDTPVATVDISSNSGTFIYNSTNIFADDAAGKDDWIVVDLKQLPTALTHGKYKARVIKNGGTAASGFTHFQMVDVNFTVTGTSISDMVCNYSSEEGTPFYLRRERIDGLGASTKQRVIPEGETSSTAPRNWGLNSTYRYVKVFVRADYGTAVKRIDVYGQFNS